MEVDSVADAVQGESQGEAEQKKRPKAPIGEDVYRRNEQAWVKITEQGESLATR
jgi:hypothetical protein